MFFEKIKMSGRWRIALRLPEMSPGGFAAFNGRPLRVPL